jgi:hypothetical protein
VAVVATGVHHTRIGRGVRQARGFADRQCVHIGAQADAAIGLATRYCRNHAMAAYAGNVRHAQVSQTSADERSGLLFLQGEFRVGVQMASPAGQGIGK